MAKTIRVGDLPEFDAAHYLDSEAAITQYLAAVAEDHDPALLAAALRDVARARSMNDIANPSSP